MEKQRVRAELVKYLKGQSLQILLDSINHNFRRGRLDINLQLASVISIYKKGDSTNLANYRPISLLQTSYKIIASLVKERLAAGLEPWIMETQYCFRPNKSTAQAIFIARRLQDMSERRGTNLSIILLDWEKAFDKVSQERLMEVMRRLDTPPKLLALIENIYSEPKFKVQTSIQASQYHVQSSGIRQGCPLSPYLFMLLMSAMFADIKARLNTPKQKEPINGIKFAEVLYADDTLLFGNHTHSLNKYLKK